MSKQLEGKTCQACHAYLFEDDDIVVCPDCGAPYHRECYREAGHCLLERYHGTELEYDKEQKRREEAASRERDVGLTCPSCGRVTHERADYCPYCGKGMSGRDGGAAGTRSGAPGGMPMYGFMPYDPCGGVPKDTVIEDGVTAAEAAAYIGPRSPRYVPRLASKRRVMWNWAAFICPSAWFAYRKQYSLAIVTFIAFLAATVCSVPLYSELLAAIQNAPTTAEDMSLILTEAAMRAPLSATLLSALSALITAATSVLSGLFGERAYCSLVLKRTAELKAGYEGDELYRYLAVKGGVNFWLFALLLIICFNGNAITELLCTLF